MRRSLPLLLLAGIGIGLGLWWYFSHSSSQDRMMRADALPAPDPAALAPARPTETLTLADGATLDLAMEPVQAVIAGKTLSMLAYNGSLPGPTIRVRQGTTVTINLTNKTDLPMTLHAHGVRMANAFDGVPDLTQKAIAPGETFQYRLTFSDPGAFWYHPHVRTDYALESGLYGALIVEPSDPAYWPAANREVALMLDDIALSSADRLPFDATVADHALMGRFGNTWLVNGETDYTLPATTGEVVRLYLTNAANTRLFNFSIPGTSLKLIGADGGRYPEERLVDAVLIAPGERRIVDVLFPRAGSFALRHTTPEREYALGQAAVADGTLADRGPGERFTALRTHAPLRAELTRLQTEFLGQAPAKSLRLALDMQGSMRQGMSHGMHMMGDEGPMADHAMGMGDGESSPYEWEDTMAAMNTRSTSAMLEWQLVDEATKKVNMDIADWKFRRGEQVKIRIVNDPKSMHPMQHPIHFHGQRFLVLATNGVIEPNPVWVDTALVATGDSVDILLEASNPGIWMVHCHILEHAESGMMLPFMVTED